MELIGKSGLIQRTLRHKCSLLRDRIQRGETVPVLERRILFTGPPGVGKTELAYELANSLCARHDLEDRNGQNVTIEVVRDWTRNDCYKSLFGELTVKFVDEIDAVGVAALNDLRTYLDRLSSHRIFLACTNSTVDKLQPQLQSRFQVFKFDPIPSSDIAALLHSKYQLAMPIALSIAQKCSGNVRAAEEDAVTQRDVAAAMAQAA